MSQGSSDLAITDLPEDILYLIIQQLPLQDFLAFCASSKSFQENSNLRFSASYWSSLARSTFRLPHHPVVAHDGRRWMSLYRRMRTQTKVYTWGNNDGGCLGGELHLQGPRVSRPRHGFAGGRFFGVRSISDPDMLHWPEQMKTERWGVISDLQCGGWSTTALNSKGSLFTVGVIDDLSSTGRIAIPSPVSHMLKYPPGFPLPAERYDPFTAIKQFSAGRCHILGLSDSGRIWSWDNANRPSVSIKFLTIDLVEEQKRDTSGSEGRVTKVLAGWNRSSAYITGSGIVIWEPSNNAEITGESDQSELDSMLVLNPSIVPKSGFRDGSQSSKQKSLSNLSLDDSDKDIGAVTSWALLTQFVIFATTTGKLYISRFSIYDKEERTTICLNGDRDFTNPTESGEFILDVQGAHQRFTVFKRDGTVLIAKEEHLHTLWNAHHVGENLRDIRAFSKIPCLQNTGVISIALGDHHYHALHSDGTISSFGVEIETCGALGLGEVGVAIMRGVVPHEGNNFGMDGKLLRECFGTGRKVIFDRERQEWLRWVIQMQQTEPVSHTTVTMVTTEVIAQVSEWLEGYLRQWALSGREGAKVEEESKGAALTARDDNNVGAEDDDDELAPYFALSVAAAGWHSGALVLVNEAKAKKAKENCRGKHSPWIWEERNEGFPRIRLRSGEIFGAADGDSACDLPAWLIEGGWKEVEQVAL